MLIRNLNLISVQSWTYLNYYYYYLNTNITILLFKSQDRPHPTSGCRVDCEQFLFSSKIREHKTSVRAGRARVTCEGDAAEGRATKGSRRHRFPFACHANSHDRALTLCSSPGFSKKRETACGLGREAM